MDNAQYLQAFLDESEENIQALNDLCLRIEQGQGTEQEFAAMFRAAHTLKGMSATMGFAEMAQLTHGLEDALTQMRAGPRLASAQAMDTLFSAIDVLEVMLTQIRAAGCIGENDYPSVLQRLLDLNLVQRHEESAVSGSSSNSNERVLAAADASLLAVLDACRDQGTLTGLLEVTVNPASIMKGPRAVLIGRVVDNYADCLHSEPAGEEMEAGVFDSELRFVLALRGGEEAPLLDAVQNVSEVISVCFTPLSQSSTDHAETDSAGETIPQTGRAPSTASMATARTERLEPTIRVPVERLDTLMNLVSELVIDKTRLQSLAGLTGTVELGELADHVSRISSELQNAVMSLRMVPVDTVFQRFPRMLRDLSKTLDKEIRLEMTGLDTEFDRTVLDEMSEVLVHLIRNAADHGLESSSVRVQSGKSEEGVICLSAYAAGQHVFIEVSDDGQGIRTDKVIERAVVKGLLDRSQAPSLSNEQVYGLLFESGFSTAEQLSEVSGRGVGLDAVKKKIESLGGMIQIESEPGQGTTFRIRLPITVSILQALFVQIHHQVFAIPLASVDEVVLADVQDIALVHTQKYLRNRDKFVPILHGGQWLFDAQDLPNLPWRLVVCKQGDQKVAIRVDGLIGQQEIVHKSLGNYLRNAKPFSGATILGDGSICLIVDVSECFVAG